MHAPAPVRRSATIATTGLCGPMGIRTVMLWQLVVAAPPLAVPPIPLPIPITIAVWRVHDPTQHLMHRRRAVERTSHRFHKCCCHARTHVCLPATARRRRSASRPAPTSSSLKAARRRRPSATRTARLRPPVPSCVPRAASHQPTQLQDEIAQANALRAKLGIQLLKP